MHVKDENLAALQARQPELPPVIGEAAVMRFVPSADRVLVNDFAVTGRTGFHVHDNEFVRAVAEALDPESPDVEKFLLPFDAGEVRRGAGLVGTPGDQGGSEAEEPCDND